MRPKPIPTPPASLERCRQQFERWRRQPKDDRRIPEALWRVAVGAARHHGVSRTARTLALSHRLLKQRADVAGGRPPLGEAGRTFVELLPPALTGSECVVELEDRRGARMKIQLRGTAGPDLAALTRAFWGGER